jgi:hypothetical protein
MIEKIFIPTVNRVDNQITYNNLPDELKKRVCFVVQEWEKNQYTYDAEYLVLPEHVNLSDYYCISKTRKIIYEAGKHMKYAVIDDDVQFKRRNSKYWSNISNMEKSKRFSTHDEIIEMFETYDSWLDEKDCTVCGCGHDENPPTNKLYSKNSSLGSALWINGNDFNSVLDDLDLTSVKVAEDTYFLLQLLCRGYGNRVSNEWLFYNCSVHKKDSSDIWDQQTFDATERDHSYIESKLPEFFQVVRDETGNRVKGGFRNYGKTRTYWSKAYKSSQQTFNTFFE